MFRAQQRKGAQAKHARERRGPRPRYYRPCLERLEDRTVLSAVTTMAADLSGQLTAIDNTLNSALDKAALVPFLNGQQGLLDAKSFVANVNARAQNALAPFTKDPTGGANDVQLEKDVKQALFNYLGPPTKQFPKALNVVGALSDITVHISGDGAHNNVKVAVEVPLRQTVAVVQTPNLKFGLGLPALPFQATAAGGVQLKVGFDFELKFGYDEATNAFSLATNNSDAQLNVPQGKLPYNLSGHLFAVEAQASLVNFSAGVDVGFFGGSATDAGNTALNAAFVIDDLTNPTDVSALGAADVNLALTLGILDGKSGGQPDANFPSINTTFALHWDFTDNAPPTAAFNDVSLSLGALFNDVISPQLLTYVQDFTKPLQPLFDVLKARLPVVSDLAGQTVTLESLLKEGANLNLFGPYSALVGLATNLVDITNFVNQLKGSGDQLMIDVGNFNLSGGNADLRNLGTATLPDALKGANWDQITSLTDPNAWQSVLGAAPDLNSVADGIKSQLDKIAGNNPGLQGVVSAAEKLLPSNVASFKLSFPFFDDPANGVFRLLLGQDPDLVSFSATFKLAAQVGAQSFGVPDLPGLSCDFSGEIDVDAYFKAAYDTYGVRQFIHDALNGSINVGDLANGFYLATDDSNNPDHPNGCHLNLSGGIKAGPELNLVFFQAGVDASISAALHLWATDPGGTGKFRLNDLQKAADLFNANGDVEAGLTAFTKVGVDLPVVGFVGTEKDYDIARTSLIDFGTSSVTVNPYMVPKDLALATPDTKDPSRLLLNLGQRAKFLTADKALAGQKDVSFSVSHVADNPNGGEVLQVSAFGFQQQFGKDQGIETIVVEGADGNDVLTIGSDQKPVLADADVTEGNGNVQVQYLGSGNAHVIAGNGNDLLQGGTGYNYFRTGSGSSSLLGGDGSTVTVAPFWKGQATTANGALYVNDFETGAGPGANALQGGKKALNHLVAAGSGTNRLVAGNQDDYLQAGRGTDTLIAGAGQDTIFLPGGTNTVVWQVGDGNLTVSTGGAAVGFSTNALEVSGSDQNDTFTLSRNPNDLTGRGVQVQADAAQINWAGFIQKVSIDGGKGNDTTTVNDLSGSTVKDVGLNDGAALAPDGGQDVVNVEGSPMSHTITVATESAFLHPPSLGQSGGVMLVQTSPQYKVHVAVTNGADTLNVFAKGRGNTVNVKSNTGHTVINADAGDDLFNVSSDAPADDGVLLDHPTKMDNRPPFGLFGQLDLHAGPGVNTLNLSESGSSQKDSVTVTDSSIVGGVLTSSDPTQNNQPVSLVYHVNYDAVGTFFGGINIKASKAADVIDVVSLPALAPATITTDGAARVVVGSDPAHPALSTLDTIRSPLVVVDHAGHKATVVRRLFPGRGPRGPEHARSGGQPSPRHGNAAGHRGPGQPGTGDQSGPRRFDEPEPGLHQGPGLRQGPIGQGPTDPRRPEWPAHPRLHDQQVLDRQQPVGAGPLPEPGPRDAHRRDVGRVLQRQGGPRRSAGDPRAGRRQPPDRPQPSQPVGHHRRRRRRVGHVDHVHRHRGPDRRHHQGHVHLREVRHAVGLDPRRGAGEPGHARRLQAGQRDRAGGYQPAGRAVGDSAGPPRREHQQHLRGRAAVDRPRLQAGPLPQGQWRHESPGDGPPHSERQRNAGAPGDRFLAPPVLEQQAAGQRHRHGVGHGRRGRAVRVGGRGAQLHRLLSGTSRPGFWGWPAGRPLGKGGALALARVGHLVELAAEALVLGLQVTGPSLEGLAADTGDGLHTPLQASQEPQQLR
jgi:hypothetical protein